MGNSSASRVSAPIARATRPVGPSQSAASLGIQAKLRVGAPDDRFERQAEAVAEQVVRRSASQDAGRAQQTVEGQEDEFGLGAHQVVQRKATFDATRSTMPGAPVEEQLARAGAGGEPLSDATLASMQPIYGRDFSGVRVHRDATAAELCGQLDALAFTRTNHIYFAPGQFDPAGGDGRRLLAHELTHVVQQGHAPARPGAPSAAAPIAAPHSAPAAAPPIQRVATWAAGAVHETNNLANSVVNGPPVGVTWPTLNGNMLSGASWSTAGARAAIARPTLTFTAVAGTPATVNATVSTVPTNTGSFDETVLAAGPWSVGTTKARVGTMFPTLAACTGAGNSTFRAIGDPNDAHMFAANRRHEDHHAADHQAAFNGSIVPWDTRLTAARTAGTTYNGANNAAAEAALWAAMGGTPDAIADAFFNACQAAVIAFHGTAAGGAVQAPTGPTANADCSTASANYHNPS